MLRALCLLVVDDVVPRIIRVQTSQRFLLLSSSYAGEQSERNDGGE